MFLKKSDIKKILVTKRQKRLLAFFKTPRHQEYVSISQSSEFRVHKLSQIPTLDIL